MSYAIHCDPHFYAGTLYGSKPHLRHDCNGQLIALPTLADAETLVRMLDAPSVGNSPYMLSHGQYASPEHSVRQSTATPPRSLQDVMAALDLQYDFAPDGSRLPIPF